jgi:hypothetical protein
MAKISIVDDVREALKDSGSVVGLGVNAFPRVGVVGLVPSYEIVCISESKDLGAIRQVVPVRSVKGDFQSRVEKLNTLALLKNEKVQEYLSSLGKDTSLFLYKSSRQIETIVDKLSLKLLSNRSDQRDVFEDKWEFRRLGAQAGLNLIAGEQTLIDDLDIDAFGNLQGKLGRKLVFQITDYSKGGGIGTFFVSDKKGLDEFHGFVGRRRKAGRDLKRVNVTRFIEGESASITSCVTRYGVLTSLVQRQIIDIPEVVGYKGRSGVFCGHDWGERYSEKIHGRARKLARGLGELMYEKGYRGIFGIDLVVNRKTSDVQMVECNPRYTAAFPVYSMLQLEAGEIPMDAWHLLEHVGIDYEMDFEAVQKSYGQVKTGAQLILHNLERAWVAVRGSVRAGVYRLKISNLKSPSRPGQRQISNLELEWVREGFSLEDIKSDGELVLTDGVLYRNLRLKPGARLGRVIFKKNVMESDRDELLPEIKEAMKRLYSLYKLEKIKREKKE